MICSMIIMQIIVEKQTDQLELYAKLQMLII